MVSFLVITFPLLELLCLCLLCLYWDLCFIYSNNFWRLFSCLLSFFWISNNNFIFYYLKFAISLIIPDALLLCQSPTHKWWVYQQLNTSKLTGMVYYNHSSLMILVNDAKYIQFLCIFSTSLSRFISHSLITQILLFRYKCWLCYLSATWLIYQRIQIIIHSINTFKNFLNRRPYICTLELPCIAWMEMKSCSKFLSILVAAVHFTDRNWIYKTVH